MCGTFDLGSCIRSVLGFGIKTGYDKFPMLAAADANVARALRNYLIGLEVCESPPRPTRQITHRCTHIHFTLQSSRDGNRSGSD
jgi:hypothetical protein